MWCCCLRVRWCVVLNVLLSVCVGCAVVCGVVVCVGCVVCGMARWNRCVLIQNASIESERPRVYGHTSACVTHVDTVPLHTKVFSVPHHTHIQHPTPKWLTQSSHVFQRLTKSTRWTLPTSSLTMNREQHVPDSSNHSLYLMNLLNSSLPERNCRGKQL